MRNPAMPYFKVFYCMIVLIVLIAVDECRNQKFQKSNVVLEPWIFYIIPNIVIYVHNN